VLNMCRPLLVYALLLAGISPLVILPARSDAAPDFPFVGLSVSAGKAIILTASNTGVYKFGTRYLPSPGLAQAEFVLHNTANHSLTVDRLQPTCHCTTGDVMVGSEVLAADQPIPILPPGGSLKVRVTVILAGHTPGPLRKSVLVFVSGHSDPAAQLDISGLLLPETPEKIKKTAKN
jgi:hypothetical protein